MGATCFVQPLDLVKNRMQLSGVGGGKKEYKTSFHAFQAILRNEGVVAMYAGLSAGLLRQATYTTTRLGIYTWLFEKFSGYDYFANNFRVYCYNDDFGTSPPVCIVLGVVFIKVFCFYVFRPKGEPPGFLMKALLGMAAGVVGAFVGTPAEVRSSSST